MTDAPAPSPAEAVGARVALCVTCGDRLPYLRRTLPKNLAVNAGYANAVTVLVDYASTDGLADYIRANHAGDITAGRLVYYRFEAAHSFRMAHAKNLAARCALLEGADILVNVDADNWTGPGFAAHVAGKFAAAHAEGESIYLRFRENDSGPGHQVAGRMRQGSAGRLAMSRAAFLATGGYDESYVFWGPDDGDMSTRLERLGYARHGLNAERHGQAIWHDNEVRFRIKEPGAPQDWGAPEIRQIQADSNVANAGKIGLGVVRRNFSMTTIALKPLPTRIFGLGLHKTATTSLSAALGILGWDCAHWESPKWAKRVLEEVRRDGRSPALEPYPAACDIPVSLLWRELDAAYPGSRFILTSREPRAWLRSVEAHWRRYRDGWPKDAASDAVHFAVYGRTDFDPDAFMARYLKHNAAVRRYFEGRENFIEMDMSCGAGWAELCAFLGQREPRGPYPCDFATPPDCRPPEPCGSG